MNNLFWLTDEQVERLRPFFPKNHGKPRVDIRRVLSGIIFINRNGLMWYDAPEEYGPPKTLYIRWKRWSDMGVFARMIEGLASKGTEQKTIMIDATYPPPGIGLPLQTAGGGRRIARLRACRQKKGGATSSAGALSVRPRVG